MGEQKSAPAINPYLGLLGATLAVSCAAILIKWSTAPPLTVAAWRMVLAAGLVGSVGLVRPRARASLSLRQHTMAAGAGIALAAHFALWTVSLGYTSVASSVLFVTVHPALVAVTAWAFLHERTSRRILWGVGLGVVGGAILAGGDVRVSGTALVGDALALGGAVAFVGYIIAGRALRSHLSALTFSWLVYVWCAAVLCVVAVVSGQGLDPRGARDVGLFVALAIIPTLGGHTVYTWTLRYLPATVVATSFLGEPIGAALLAWVFLGQRLGVPTVIGGGLVLCGLALTVESARTPRQPGTVQKKGAVL